MTGEEGMMAERVSDEMLQHAIRANELRGDAFAVNALTELLAYRQAARALVEARDRSLAMVLDNRKWDESQGAEDAAIDALRALVKGE